ncbi:hypothetical protein AGMMS49525_15630 [Bacteroidia bacterium]|nr:hypothetical protein AGMMS49525_15630 [Bacteroidia bacterium]
MYEKNKRIKPNGLFSPPVVSAGDEANNYGLSNFYMSTLAELDLPNGASVTSKPTPKKKSHAKFWLIAFILLLLLLSAYLFVAPSIDLERLMMEQWHKITQILDKYIK